ncbi:hypothetical protein J1N35_004169 [Gossypium stocksii]|uniref:Uncharacterized protein n=1 Tax=Gossypium stocksii TaxID=47602 RepID=A0A9D4AHE8_9ROSI|nr:hypothetical protein J1N35_004169 [Gossypium stocksii]
MQLGLDADVQKLEAEKLRKGKHEAEEDLHSLKTYYKKMRRSMRIAVLGKTSEQWRKEVKEEKRKTSQWEKRFQDTRVREYVLERSLLENQNEKEGLKARISELERSLHQYRNCNTAIELKASIGKIEELKGRIEELETALQN